MPRKIELKLAPKDLKVILFSHGWLVLAPYEYNENPLSLKFPYDTPGGCGLIEIRAAGRHCELVVHRGSFKTAQKITERVLALDCDLKKTYRLAGADPQFAWFKKRKFGRLLRTPTLFEDCLKTIFSANTVFKRTITMTQKLVALYGTDIAGYRAFPTPRRLAKVREKEFREKIGCGYRAPYLISLIEKALEKPDIFVGDGWKALDSDRFAGEISAVKGIGPGAVNNISCIYQKPQSFVIDSYVVKRAEELWGVKPDRLENYLKNKYGRFDTFAPIVFWFDMVRLWKENRK
jgi:3-methyladenine DNA glycosylase/8-oxoguanine DNA glycosylase